MIRICIQVWYEEVNKVDLASSTSI